VPQFQDWIGKKSISRVREDLDEEFFAVEPAEIADCFAVTTRTLSNWLAQYTELRDAVDAGNDVFNPRVERALAERALGYEVDVRKYCGP
jgi:hypothetical protein